MTTSQNLNVYQQIELLIDRGITMPNKDKEKNAEKLSFINYYKLKELAYPFSIETDESIKYENLSFKSLITRYYQDKNLRRDLLHCIEKIEVAFKTKFAYYMGNKHGPKGYLKFDKWMNKEKYCKFYISDKQKQFKEMLRDNFINGRYKRSLCLKEYFNNNPKDKEDRNIPIWIMVELLTFGEVVVLFDYMSTSGRKEISKNFGCHHEEMESWLKALRFIRNQCAHNFNVIDLKLRTKPKIKEEWKEYLNLDENGNTSGGLAEIILILTFLTTKINSKYAFNSIQRSINAIVKDSDINAKKLGFSSENSAKRAVYMNGGYFKRRTTKPKFVRKSQ